MTLRFRFPRFLQEEKRWWLNLISRTKALKQPASIGWHGGAKAVFAIAIVLALSLAPSLEAFAQKTFTKRYPAGKNVRLQLKNGYGTVTVQAWDQNEIKVSASMDRPLATLTPEETSDSLVINVVRDNRGRDEVGDVNFRIWVPANSIVDIETRRGQITIRGVQGAMVRAKVWLGGDIELTDIRSGQVMAENSIGDIFFDGVLAPGGVYEFTAKQGNINIRIPFDSAFKLVAAAPTTRNIALGSFGNAGLNFISEGRKIVGTIGDGRALLTVTNYRGSISFIQR